MPSKEESRELSRAEWLLMNICWNRGKASARDIFEETLKTKRRSYQTIKTMLDRLVDKGYLSREKFGPIWLYNPVVKQEPVIGREIDNFVDTVLDKTFTPLFVHLSKKEKFSVEEVAALQKLIEAHKDDDIHGAGGL